MSPRRRQVVGATAIALLVAVVGLMVVGPRLVGPGRGGGSSALPPPHFVDETVAAGVDQIYDGSSTFSVGGGLAAFDCNADGRPDLYLSGGARPAALYRNDGPVGGSLRFGRMTDPATDLTRVTGAYPLDIDGDGRVDLAVLRVGENVLLRGLGDCRFERANERLAFDGGDSMTTAFSATWETAAGLPTLAIGNYLELDGAGESTTGCAENALIRPTADGGRYAAPIALQPGYCALSMLFSDWSRSGRRDLRVSNDRHYYDNAVGEEQLWQVAPGNPPRPYTSADGWAPVQVEGMGIASYDVTGDSYPDVFLTSQAANRLQTLTNGPSQPTYGDIGLKRGVNATRPYTGGDEDLPSTAWHPEFGDVNNDGRIDLFITKGNVTDQPDYARKDPPNLLIGQADGTFREAGMEAGIVGFARGRGAALVDLNLDGLLDLVEVDYGSAARVWRNLGAGTTGPQPIGNWLAVSLSQPGSNRSAIGAWIDVRDGDVASSREVTVGGGHVSGELGWIHVGLGAAARAEIRVRWPDGEHGPWLPSEANQFVEIERGAAAVRSWTPGNP